ncbi:RibD domain-containing protein [Stackebrandtia albiflava]|uniref:RibD domain-containing protein n=1 Tax=Stackebrandtia albiflava TaxID=406432 RepID=A0A562ULQ0_9ACTN|nr:dihydrofolate reductase family protein [Stackebrandtia albiflava]TWJ06516.1 RibD domain-containing protein [Stackebrandtia albiflava]
MRSLVYFVGVTADGFIAAPDGSLDHFAVTPELVEFVTTEYPETLPAPAREAMGVADAPNRHFDTVIMGHTTYRLGVEQGVTSPYPHLRQYVATSRAGVGDPAVTVVADPVAAVRRWKSEPGGDIWLAGGGTLAAALVSEIDRLVFKVYPVVAGTGVPVFGGGFTPRHLTSTGTERLAGGHLIQEYSLT